MGLCQTRSAGGGGPSAGDSGKQVCWPAMVTYNHVAGTGKMVDPPRKGTSPPHEHMVVAPSWDAIGRGHRASRS